MPSLYTEARKQKNRERYHDLKETNPFHHKCLYIKIAAKRKGVPFNLTSDYLKDLWTGYCPVSKEPIYLYNHRNEENHAELDRINPKEGYTMGNVVWLSRKFNRYKDNGTLEDFEKLVAFLKNLRDAYG